MYREINTSTYQLLLHFPTSKTACLYWKSEEETFIGCTLTLNAEKHPSILLLATNRSEVLVDI